MIETCIDTGDIFAFDVVIDLSIASINHRGSKYTDFDAGIVEIEPHGVERTPHV